MKLKGKPQQNKMGIRQTRPKGPIGLEDLSPPDLSHVIKFLSWKDKRNLRRVSKYFQTNINTICTWKLEINMLNFREKIDMMRQGKISKQFDSVILILDEYMNSEQVSDSFDFITFL